VNLNQNGEELVSVTVLISQNEAEAILHAVDMRRRWVKTTGYYEDELGERLANTFEIKFNADSGWWSRIKSRVYKVFIK
jgi:hypothetical protein